MIHSNKKLHGIFTALAWGAIVGALSMLLLIAFWLMKPYHIVDVKQPFIVLNENKTVNVNGFLLLEIDLDVKLDYRPVSAPIITCKSGNLVSLSSNLPADIPIGKYVFEADPIAIAPKFTIGDRCQYIATLTWEVNPVRTITETYYSEFFTIAKPIIEE